MKNPSLPEAVTMAVSTFGIGYFALNFIRSGVDPVNVILGAMVAEAWVLILLGYKWEQ